MGQCKENGITVRQYKEGDNVKKMVLGNIKDTEYKRQ